MQIGNYETAISVAPQVSLKYWQQCIKAYISHLDDDQAGHLAGSEEDRQQEKLNYLLLISQTDEAASLMHKRGETQEAKAVKALKIAGFFPNPLGMHERSQSSTL